MPEVLQPFNVEMSARRIRPYAENPIKNKRKLLAHGVNLKKDEEGHYIQKKRVDWIPYFNADFLRLIEEGSDEYPHYFSEETEDKCSIGQVFDFVSNSSLQRFVSELTSVNLNEMFGTEIAEDDEEAVTVLQSEWQDRLKDVFNHIGNEAEITPHYLNRRKGRIVSKGITFPSIKGYILLHATNLPLDKADYVIRWKEGRVNGKDGGSQGIKLSKNNRYIPDWSKMNFIRTLTPDGLNLLYGKAAAMWNNEPAYIAFSDSTNITIPEGHAEGAVIIAVYDVATHPHVDEEHLVHVRENGRYYHDEVQYTAFVIDNKIYVLDTLSDDTEVAETETTEDDVEILEPIILSGYDDLTLDEPAIAIVHDEEE